MFEDGDQLADDIPYGGSNPPLDNEIPDPAAEVNELEETLAQIEQAKQKNTTTQ